eukprot:gene14443-10321_t
MLTGHTNAKRDFPTDFAQYFKDDTEVMTHFKHGGSKTFCEPWSPPGVVGSIHFVYTLKTALQCESSSFMLGTFELVNDLMIGEVTAKDFDHNAHAPLPLLHHIENANKNTEIADLWFQNAFSQLPIDASMHALSPGILAGAHDEPAAHDAHTNAPAAAHDAAPVPVLYHVYVLRPSMKNNAEPFYENGALVH